MGFAAAGESVIRAHGVAGDAIASLRLIALPMLAYGFKRGARRRG